MVYILARSSKRPLLKLIKRIICKLFSWKFIHEVSSIINFDCRDNYSGIQQNFLCKAGSSQNSKMHVELKRSHVQQFLSRKSYAECFTKKQKRQHYHQHVEHDYRRESKNHWYASARCWCTIHKQCFLRLFANPCFLLTNVTVYDKLNWTGHFQVAKHFGCWLFNKWGPVQSYASDT